MEAKKVIAVLVVCMAVMEALHVEGGDVKEYKECEDTCMKECFKDGKGQGYTHCEMKCDTECGAKSDKAKLDHLVT